MNTQIEEIEVLAEDILQEYTNCYSEVDKEVLAKMIYNAGYRKQAWISVDERLPEPLTDVLVCDAEGTVSIDFVLKSSGEFVQKDVTHWMPLPEAPKMKGGAE